MNDTLLWYTTRGSGAVSLLLLSAVMVLGILSVLRVEAPGWPRFLTPALHRNLALTAVCFVGLHVLTAVIDPFAHLGWVAAVVPFGSYYRTLWLGLGTVSMELGAAVVITSLLRRALGYRMWRGVHWAAVGCWPLALVHSLGTGTDSRATWMLGVVVVSAGSVGLAAGVRLLSPSPNPLPASTARFSARKLTR